MPTKYGKTCIENSCSITKYGTPPIMLCRSKNPQNVIIARGIWARVFLYDLVKITIRLASTIIFAIDMDVSIATMGSIVLLVNFTKT